MNKRSIFVNAYPPINFTKKFLFLNWIHVELPKWINFLFKITANANTFVRLNH